jgi:hypothetical protein
MQEFAKAAEDMPAGKSSSFPFRIYNPHYLGLLCGVAGVNAPTVPFALCAT